MALGVEESQVDTYKTFSVFDQWFPQKLSWLLVCQFYVCERAEDLSYI